MFKKNRRSISLHVFFLICLATFIGCRQSSAKPQGGSVAMKTLKFNSVGGDLPSLHPHVGTDLRGRSMQKALFEGLTRINEAGVPELAGVEEIEISDSKKTYIFHLRPNHWSNGEEVIASDYELTWKQALTPGTECRLAEYFFVIKNGEKAKRGEVSIDQVGIRAIDDKTLVVELEHPTPYFLGLTATALFSPLHQGDSKEPSLFNGPFLVSSWERENILRLAPNLHYWDQRNVHLDGIEVFMVRDGRVAFEMYEKGELNWIGDPFSPIPQDAFMQLDKIGKIKKKEIARICLIFCNTRVFPLHVSALRRALDLAINRQELSEHILLGQRGQSAPVPFHFSFLNDDTLSLKENIVGATAFFEEALQELKLTKNNFPALTYSYDQDDPIFKNIALYLQRRWEDVLGIKVNLRGYSWNNLYADLNRHQFELGSCIQASLFSDPLFNLAMYEDATHPVNWTGWESKEYQTLLGSAKNTIDIDERNKLLEMAEKILVAEKPTLPLYTQTYFYMTHEDIENLDITDLGYVEFKHMSFKKPSKR